MKNKLSQDKSGENFNFGITITALAITISLLAFVSEESKITGFAVSGDSKESINDEIIPDNLIEFNDIGSLRSLAPGSYYIGESGIVYWLYDNSKPAIAKVKNIDDLQKSREIYIDKNGNIGYILNSIG